MEINTRHLGVQMTRQDIERLRSVADAYDVAKAPGENVYERCGIGVSGIIQLWCVPDDKPTCWDAPLTPGAWGPSELVGDLGWVEQPDGKYELVVKVYGRALLEERHKRARIDGYASYLRSRTFSDEDTASLLDWLEAKARALIRLADLEDDIIGMRCPWCDWTLYRGELLNRLVEHVVGQHTDIKVEGVTLGSPPTINTSGGDVPLSPAYAKRKKEGEKA